ncbi:rRNA pseudouridine synthase [Candidatus Pacearchaeota archaeon]|nr:rRNA pseudouridine synthase [Candidatus Pacearchaeota archaeon]
MERIQKIIANSGYCSRRKAEELIEQGKVKLNNKIAKLGDKANPEDKITINDSPLKKSNIKSYFILNKPKGILVTKHDPKNRRTIYNLKSISKNIPTLNHVGRLDAMSEGLLILTNDGNLIQKLTHPKHAITKTYQVRTEPILKKQDITNLKSGILIDDRKFYATISNIKNNTFHVSIQEGRNRIIRRVLEKLNYKIYQLKRISIANIKLENLKSGEIKEISEEKIKQLIL